ncbi:threonine synthase [Paenibacillus baekrokdamisoli]|uniref:Threonine synthase n=1 Tax=Paenibacillus baekrokdamisoli TaxID=1712516 RepID=A0A3G9IUJ0_9BACL|nr:threonine synthase [Paenibacillus baekrokdamisoli]MBB3067102.1 threonine synthase [Paenibacillus baekrokdamisoli]BBH19705.1 threonine synthase [Paenibacillus baekrokdamisoli]
MEFVSTRGNVGKIGFIDAFMMGLGNDGGLLVPHEIPVVSAETLQKWQELDYQELVLAIFSLYTNGEIPEQDLKELVYASYSTFRDPAVTPVRKLKDDLYLLELFHGPTFAFKDIALQFMGQLYTYVAAKQNKKIHILGATSGDTGASAIEGVKGKDGIKICILHPHGKVSKVQELQMTTIQDDNVLNLSVDGNFDDCQRMIKDLFADLDFKAANQLAAINSINFVRIMAQTVYYFYAYFQVAKQTGAKRVSFSVPTGNFGDIFAGYLAKRMGLPVGKLILATNENNILERFVLDGLYKPGDFRMTYSPSMDIQVASNFERYLYYVLGENAEQTRTLMEQFKSAGEITISGEALANVQADLSAYGVQGQECLNTIKQYEAATGYLLDPHSACGVAAADKCSSEGEITVSLATAHPAKFNEAIELCGIEQQFPEQISALFEKPQRQTRVDGSLQSIVRELEAFYNGK